VNRTLIVTPAARAEIVDALEWYESQQEGLGHRFLRELEIGVGRVASNPAQFPHVFDDIRRARLNKFPYALFFRIEQESVVEIACFHASRNPRHWQHRV
jgi:toxin ParE1/3/4